MIVSLVKFTFTYYEKREYFTDKETEIEWRIGNRGICGVIQKISWYCQNTIVSFSSELKKKILFP